jgi:hypothetical protein
MVISSSLCLRPPFRTKDARNENIPALARSRGELREQMWLAVQRDADFVSSKSNRVEAEIYQQKRLIKPSRPIMVVI